MDWLTMGRCIDPVDLSAWVDGEVNLRRSRAIRQHVESCPLCAAEVAALQRVRQAVRLLAGSEFRDGTELLVTGQAGQRRQGRHGYAESQRLLKRLRAELTREQARVAWGRGARYTAWRQAFPSVWPRGRWAWQAVALALLLATGVAGSLRLSLLSSPSRPASQPTAGRDGPDAPAAPAVARLTVTEGEGFPVGNGAGGGTAAGGQPEQRSPAATPVASPAGDGEGNGSYRSSYARGGVKLATNATQTPEAPGLVFWADGIAAPTRVPANAATAAPHSSPTTVETERTSVETTVGVSDIDGTVSGGGGTLVASAGADGGLSGSSGDARVSAAAVSALPVSAGQASQKAEREKAASGVRPQAASAVRPATLAAAVTGEKEAAGRAASQEYPPGDNDRSESEYQREHERFAATVGSDPVDSSEEALIKRVLLAATAP